MISSATSSRQIATIVTAAVVLSPLPMLVRIRFTAPAGLPLTVAAVQGINSISNYVSYAIYVACVLGAALVLPRMPIWKPWRVLTPLVMRRAAVAFALAMIAWNLPYIVDVPAFYTLHDTLDPLHESEILGLAPYARAARDFPKPVLVHGLGVDYAPARMGSMVAPKGSGVAVTRVFVRVLSSAAVVALLLAALAIYRERADAMRIPEPVSRVLEYWVVGCWLVAVVGLTAVNGRHLFFWLQIALLFAGARSMRRATNPVSRSAVFAGMGALVPVAIVYNYGFGVAGAGVTGIGILLLVWGYRMRFSRELLTVAGAMMASTAILAVLLGRAQLSAVVHDVVYWSAAARLVSFQPATGTTVGTPQMLLMIVALCALLLSVSGALWCFWRSGARFDEVFAGGVLLAVAATEMRPYLDRSDIWHLRSILPSFLLICIYLCLPVLARAGLAVLSPLLPEHAERLKWAALAVFAVLGISAVNPVVGFYHIGETLLAGRISDRRIVPADKIAAAQALEPDLKGQKCFYALSNSAVWYYLVDLPSCSSFYQPHFARTPEAQAQVVADLQRYRPRIILAVDRGDVLIDDLPVSSTCPTVWKYIQTAYTPYRTVSGRDFYRLRDSAQYVTPGRTPAPAGRAGNPAATQGDSHESTT